MKSHRLITLLAVAAFALSLISASAPIPVAAATLPSTVTFTPVITGLNQPVFVTNAGDGSGRLFVVQQTGQIRVFKNGSLLATNFLDVSGVSNFTNAGSEQGLLGLAFDPNYATNRFFYITYTITTGNATFPYGVRLVRYQTSSGNADVANPSSAFIILMTPKKFTNHNGGMIGFGGDGYLYWGTGDGGSGGDPDNNAQTLSSLLGKMLRLDVDTTPPAGQRYVIPPSNPFFGNPNPSVRKEIWAYGLRNPWRWSFDRSTGDMLIGDVGQDREEEIDFQPASSTGGMNYGWHILEGNLCYLPLSGCSAPAHYVAPIAVYLHGTNDVNGCAVTGGYMYRGSAAPGLQGVYFYSDYCSGKLWALVHNSGTWSGKLVTSTPYHVSSFGQDEAGEIYIVDRTGGQVVRIGQRTIVTAPAFLSEGVNDGTVTQSSAGSNTGGALNSTWTTFTVGDTALHAQRRAVLSFDTSSLPDTAVVTSATIKIKLWTMTTPSPFGTLGNLTADVAKGFFGTSPALESVDYQASATGLSAATFGSTANAGWYSAPVSASMLGSINRLGRTQFRLRFALQSNNDSVANYAAFFSGDALTSSNRPQVIVQYYVP